MYNQNNKTGNLVVQMDFYQSIPASKIEKSKNIIK